MYTGPCHSISLHGCGDRARPKPSPLEVPVVHSHGFTAVSVFPGAKGSAGAEGRILGEAKGRAAGCSKKMALLARNGSPTAVG